jgi:phosphatidylglycerol---prolipoprotein diacylglyceryl transferase
LPKEYFAMFSRCYPTLSDFLQYNFGLDIPLPIFSFGFFVALGFLAAAWVLSSELKRKEAFGIIGAQIQTIEIGNPASLYELVSNGLLGFVLGYKLLAIALDYGLFMENPQAFLLSTQGNILGGILGAAALAYMKYAEKKKQQLPQPKKESITIHPYELTGDITIMAAIGGISGAKLFYLFETPGNFTEFINDPFGSFFGGLTIYGGLVGGALVVWLYLKTKGIQFIHVADSVAPGLLLAYGIGRMGCQVSGDGDWGIVNAAPNTSFLPDWLWAQHYAHNILNEGILIEGCKEAHCYMLSQPVYPTPIYEFLMASFLFSVLWFFRKKIVWAGFMFFAYMTVNGLERLFIEQYRVNTKLKVLGNIEATQAEVIAVLFMLVGLIGMFFSYRKGK